MKSSLRTALLILFSACSFVKADKTPKRSNDSARNQNVFQKHGISEEIPKLGISNLSQGNNLLEHVERTYSYDGETRTSEVFLIRGTDAKGNIDLRMKYDPEKMNEEGDLIKRLEEISKTEYLQIKQSHMMDKNQY